jgi:hypothetical protein
LRTSGTGTRSVAGRQPQWSVQLARAHFCRIFLMSCEALPGRSALAADDCHTCSACQGRNCGELDTTNVPVGETPWRRVHEPYPQQRVALVAAGRVDAAGGPGPHRQPPEWSIRCYSELFRCDARSGMVRPCLQLRFALFVRAERSSLDRSTTWWWQVAHTVGTAGLPTCSRRASITTPANT